MGIQGNMFNWGLRGGVVVSTVASQQRVPGLIHT